MSRYFKSIKFMNVFLTIILLFWSKTNNTQNSKVENILTTTTGESNKRALLIGIDKYRHSFFYSRFSNLSGCVNDVMDMQNLLIVKFGFMKENIKLLTNEQATHSVIVQTFKEHLIDQAQPNDIIVIHFSGHGSRMKDTSGDEPDGYDETLVPYDTRDPEGKIFDISDDEINGLLKQLNTKAKNVTFIFDACHSGTATRAAVGIREIPIDDREPPVEQPPYALTTRGVSEGKNDLRRDDLDFVLISACSEKESAYEHFADEKSHGALTYFLVNQLKSAGAGVTYQDVMDNVGYKINFSYPNQHPQLEGTQRKNYVFSDSSSIAQSYILANPKNGKKVKLEAGLVHGLTEGSVYDIYAPCTTKFELPAKPIAQVEITEVRNFESEGEIKDQGQIVPGSRAIEREHHYPDLKLRTHFLNLDQSPTLQAVKKRLGDFEFIELINEPVNYTLLLQEKNKRIVIEGPDTTEISTPVSINEPDVQLRVVEDVKKWAKWFNILGIENRNTKLNVEIELIPLNSEETGRQENGDTGLVVKNLDHIRCKIHNKSRKDLYFVILDLSSDGSVTPIAPSEGASELIAAESSWPEDIEVYIPDGIEKVKDVLKVLATSEPISNLDIFAQAPIKKGETQTMRDGKMPNPIEQLFANAASGTVRGSRVLNTGDWMTTETVFFVVR